MSEDQRMKTILLRIKKCMEDNGDDKASLARKLNLSKSAVTRWFDGTHKTMRMDNLMEIADVYKANPLWLYGDDVPKEIESQEHHEKRVQIESLLFKASNKDLDKLLAILKAYMEG